MPEIFLFVCIFVIIVVIVIAVASMLQSDPKEDVYIRPTRMTPPLPAVRPRENVTCSTGACRPPSNPNQKTRSSGWTPKADDEMGVLNPFHPLNMAGIGPMSILMDEDGDHKDSPSSPDHVPSHDYSPPASQPSFEFSSSSVDSGSSFDSGSSGGGGGDF